MVERDDIHVKATVLYVGWQEFCLLVVYFAKQKFSFARAVQGTYTYMYFWFS